MSTNENNKKLVLERVKDLRKRIKSAIRSGRTTLTYSLAMEYLKLISSAMGCIELDGQLFRELLFLQAETATYPSPSKDDRLAQLRWLDNSTAKLEVLVKGLSPDIEMEVKLHPRVLNVSEKLFKNGHYPQAVFEALKSLEEYVKEKSGIKDKSGKKLMGYVFNEEKPILKIKYSRPDTAKEEQEGFKFIFMGAMLGIRNPKAHYKIVQRDKARTVQYLALASILFKTVDDATLTQHTNIEEQAPQG